MVNKYQVLIDHNFLSDSRDEANIVEAIKKAREVLSSKEFDEVRGEEMAPGQSIQSDEELLSLYSSDIPYSLSSSWNL